jgi:hypothetical protein
MSKSSPNQFELFEKSTFPVREPVGTLDIERFRSRLKRSMAEAIRQCPHDRAIIAARMAQYLGLPSISRSVLDAYTAESKPHDPTLPRFKAFVKATGAVWLWDEIVKDDGLTLLQGDEAMLAEIALLQQQQREIAVKLKELRSVPVNVKDARR